MQVWLAQLSIRPINSRASRAVQHQISIAAEVRRLWHLCNLERMIMWLNCESQYSSQQLEEHIKLTDTLLLHWYFMHIIRLYATRKAASGCFFLLLLVYSLVQFAKSKVVIFLVLWWNVYNSHDNSWKHPLEVEGSAFEHQVFQDGWTGF